MPNLRKPVKRTLTAIGMQRSGAWICQDKKLTMRLDATLVLLLIMHHLISCKKEDKATPCFPDTPTTRVIDKKKAVVKLTATAVEPVYLVEQGTIDTRLIPCDFPMEFYQHDLQVTVSGEVKATQQTGAVPCCAENFVITSISR